MEVLVGVLVGGVPEGHGDVQGEVAVLVRGLIGGVPEGHGDVQGEVEVAVLVRVLVGGVPWNCLCPLLQDLCQDRPCLWKLLATLFQVVQALKDARSREVV